MGSKEKPEPQLAHIFNDAPILTKENDLYGITPFASALARGILRISAPDGAVIAINGPWGSGKSSALNLIIDELQPAIESDQIRHVSFAPWAVSGPDAIILGFLQTLYAALDTGPLAKAREGLVSAGRRIAPHLDRSIPIAEAVGAAMGAPGLAGPAASLASGWFAHAMRSGTSEEAFQRLRDALSQANTRYLVTIDDLDRLDPAEFVTMLKLVKSVGRLPNVIYILAFDNSIATQILQASGLNFTGADYLDKIIQTTFDMPDVAADSLRQSFLDQVVAICGAPKDDEDATQFVAAFYDCVAPWLRTPRNLTRLINGIAVAWPAVANEVYAPDFFALEAIKLFAPETYRAIRRNSEMLLTKPNKNDFSAAELAKHYDAAFSINSGDQGAIVRNALKHLFPALNAVWDEHNFAADSADEKHIRRCVSARAHFWTYFRFDVDADTLKAETVGSFLSKCDEHEFVRSYFLTAIEKRHGGAKSHAAIMLDELTIRAAEVPEAKVAPLMAAICAVADDLNVSQDDDKDFLGAATNMRRIDWLASKMIRDRFGIDTSSFIMKWAAEKASLGYLTNLAARVQREHNDPTFSGRRPIVTLDMAKQIVSFTKVRLENEAEEKLLTISNRWIGPILFNWQRMDERAVRTFTDNMIHRNEFVLAVAEAMMTEQKIASGRTLTTQIVATPDAWSKVLDVDRFLKRIAELEARNDLNCTASKVLKNFRKAVATALEGA